MNSVFSSTESYEPNQNNMTLKWKVNSQSIYIKPKLYENSLYLNKIIKCLQTLNFTISLNKS